jgi:hypothetical protein
MIATGKRRRLNRDDRMTPRLALPNYTAKVNATEPALGQRLAIRIMRSVIRQARIHDLSEEGLPRFFTLKWGRINQHRLTGRRLLSAVKRTIEPSRKPMSLSYATAASPKAVRVGEERFRGQRLDLATIAEVARTERPRTLVDLLFRRVDLSWGPFLPYIDVCEIAATVAPVMGWSVERMSEEIDRFAECMSQQHLYDMTDAIHSCDPVVISGGEGAFPLAECIQARSERYAEP